MRHVLAHFVMVRHWERLKVLLGVNVPEPTQLFLPNTFCFTSASFVFPPPAKFLQYNNYLRPLFQMVRKIHFSSVPLILTWTIKSFLKSWNCCDSLVLRSTCQALSQSVISSKSVVEPPKSAKEVNYHSIDTTMVMKHPAKTNARIIGHDVTMWETGCNERSKSFLGSFGGTE